MPAYILRYTGTKFLAGFYAAESEYQLFDLIDEETDPSDYQYAVVRQGFGIQFWKEGEAVGYQIGTGDEALSEALASATTVPVTHELAMAMLDDEELTWRTLFQK